MIRVTVKGVSETLNLFQQLPERMVLALVQAMRDVAINSRDSLAAQMSPAEIEEAQRRAQIWKPNAS